MADSIVNEKQQRAREAQRRYRESGKWREYRQKNKARHCRHNLNRRNRLIAANLCAYCGKVPPRPKYRSCEACSKIVTAATKAWREKCVSNGICPVCGKNPVLPSMKGKNWSFCERCYFKKTSTDCLKTAKHAELIGQKLKDQNYRCAYTGEKIILGLNDSLDHILPISRYPELRSDPFNVEWVTRKVNCMKWDSTRDEFIATTYAVVKHFENRKSGNV